LKSQRWQTCAVGIDGDLRHAVPSGSPLVDRLANHAASPAGSVFAGGDDVALGHFKIITSLN
jgi:hypothetical protein